MNRKISDRVKKTCLAMMSLILMLSLLPACMGEAAEDKGARTETISASFPYYSKVITWNYPYSDALFLQPSDVYSHPFAQLSMGVAYAAFRSEHKETQDEYLIVYAVLKGLFAGKITEVKGILIVVIYITFFVAALLLFHSEKTEGAQVAGKAVTEGT